jgi:aryl-alcohol dehydrogenase-like predicted oxidoreductase
MMMKNRHTRRQFLQHSAAAATWLPAQSTPVKRTAVDQVTLGRTGLKLSRLGLGTGSDSGHVQQALGQEQWTEVHLVRVNPQGMCMDGENETYNMTKNPVAPVLEELKIMREKGRGVIGMKMVGNGTFVDAADREKAIRFAMSRPELDAVVIGFKNRAEIDEAIRRMNAALT